MMIAMANPSSGVGKTTLAIHLADVWSGEGGGVVLIDADPRAHALQWAQRRLRAGRPKRFHIIEPARTNVRQGLQQLVSDAAHVVIDLPARMTLFAQLTLLMADLVLVPTLPHRHASTFHRDVAGFIREARERRPQLRAALLINRRVEGTFLEHPPLHELPLPVLSSGVHQRQVFVQGGAAGLLVREIAPHGYSAAEVVRIAEEVRRFAR